MSKIHTVKQQSAVKQSARCMSLVIDLFVFVFVLLLIRYQYEDASGTPYYFDRLTNKTQYHIPTDAPIRHWTEDLRDAYDAEHGPGAYDAMMAEREFMRSVNEDGGWFDENGEWVAATGYYADDGTWIAYEGYYDENGKYRKYAKVQGDLSFMV